MAQRYLSKDRYIMCMLVHALGDTIGFKNGDWEFNNGKGAIYVTMAHELVDEFISLGGVNRIDISKWIISDDTVFHLMTAKTFVDSDAEAELDIHMNNMVKHLCYAVDKMDIDKRIPGETTMKGIKRFHDHKKKWTEVPYDIKYGGAGGSMRTPCLGLIFPGEKYRDDLIKYSIESCRLTHNSAIGYLGGITSALFTAFALEGIDIRQWGFKLMELLESDRIDKYMKSTRGFEEYDRDKHIFIARWKQYLDDKFILEGDGLYKMKDPIMNVAQRSRYYYINFRETTLSDFVGSGGDDSVIIAYDCLLDAGDIWEKLIIYAMLHIGDTDTTGCIAGAWYGALYGKGDIPRHMFENIEYKDLLEEYGNKLYSQFSIRLSP